MKHCWGIDMGGTKIEGVVLTNSTEIEVLVRERIPTEAHLGYDHMLSQIKTLIEILIKETGQKPEKIGFGTPGTLEPFSQLMKNCNTTALNGMPLKKDLESLLGIEINITNDANCFAMAETHLGIVRDHLDNPECVFGIIMGTGVGGGVVVHGKVLNGMHGIGGEWGHNFLDEEGGECYCGKTGCVEKFISGPALEQFYHKITSQQKRLKEINILAGKGDEAALNTMDRLHTYFGKAVANVINIIDPQAIVIGGGVGNIDSIYTKGVEEACKHVFNPRLDTLFLKPKLGDSAGVFGAALL